MERWLSSEDSCLSFQLQGNLRPSSDLYAYLHLCVHAQVSTPLHVHSHTHN